MSLLECTQYFGAFLVIIYMNCYSIWAANSAQYNIDFTMVEDILWKIYNPKLSSSSLW